MQHDLSGIDEIARDARKASERLRDALRDAQRKYAGVELDDDLRGRLENLVSRATSALEEVDRTENNWIAFDIEYRRWLQK